MTRAFSSLTIIAGLMIAMLALPLQTANAFESPATGQNLQVLEAAGQSYQPFASAFGCDDYAFANVGPASTAILEYVPTGDNVQTWTRLFTVTVFPLQGTVQQQAPAAAQMAKVLVDNFSQNAKVINAAVSKNDYNEDEFYIEYMIGEGDMTEHNAGVFFRSSDNTFAMMQVQARGMTLDETDKTNIQKILTRTLFEQSSAPQRGFISP